MFCNFGTQNASVLLFMVRLVMDYSNLEMKRHFSSVFHKANVHNTLLKCHKQQGQWMKTYVNIYDSLLKYNVKLLRFIFLNLYFGTLVLEFPSHTENETNNVVHVTVIALCIHVII